MLCAFGSIAGGVGTTTVSVAVAFEFARRCGHALIIDAGGASDLLAVEDPRRLAPTLDAADPLRLRRAATRFGDSLSVLACGPAGVEAVSDHLGSLRSPTEPVVIDGGRIPVTRPEGTARGWARMVDQVDRVVVVCRLDAAGMGAVARRQRSHDGPPPFGVAVVREPSRRLDARAVEEAFRAPVLAVFDWDPAVMRLSDRRLFDATAPRRLRRAVRQLCDALT